MREFLGDLLQDQQQPAQALKEHETSFAEPTFTRLLINIENSLRSKRTK
jgi:hypothetical protein